MPDPERTIRCIPLHALIPSPHNVRKTPAEGSAFVQLKASIAAHGLLENLLVQPAERDGDGADCFEVVAGARRLAALQALAEEGAVAPDHPVPCHVTAGDNAVELSLVENTVRAAMHPADQVEAFAEIAADGGTVAEIAARFGVSERTVEQRLRLGNAAPELLDAYRAGDMGLQCLQAFCITADAKLQLAVWEELKAQHYGPSVWQIRRLLTEGRIPATAAIAQFIGADAYEAAGGALTRDLFAEEDERGTWFDDPALLRRLALERLEAAAEELRTKWSWAEARIEVEWSDTARFARVRPKPGEPTGAEAGEIERITARRDELNELDGEAWTEDAENELDRIEARLDEIHDAVAARAVFRRKDTQMAGAIVTVGDDGGMRVIQGLVRPEDLPGPAGPADSESPSGNGTDTRAENPDEYDDRVQPPALSRPDPVPDPAAEARKRVGIGIGLGDDLRAVRTSLIKAHLAEDFEAAFDLCVFQMARAVFLSGYRPHALDIRFEETADRPPMRRNDEDFAEAARGEGMLEINRAILPLDWLEIEDDYDAFQALRDLTPEQKQSLFAACVARTVQGQLAFELSARPELEATVSRLDIDFARLYRPDAALFWNRLTKARLLEIATSILGPDWAAARAKSKKTVLVSSMARAFGTDDEQASHIPAAARAAALKWTPPGFRPFDAGEAKSATEAADTAADSTEPVRSQQNGEDASAPANGSDAAEDPRRAAANGEDIHSPDAPATEVPEFLRVSP
ncbi:MAG: ParB N-terminal domain-containing protein [Rhodospirillaceae bacterium]|nr:ParB N-terminal domain-containing protein [Rhodospirillaceae bacterium]